MMVRLLEKLQKGFSLTQAEVEDAVESLTDETVPLETKADFLTALALKGETVEELSAFASSLRAKSVQPPISEAVRNGFLVDVCGTGGDHLNTFNISTTVAILVSACGVAVAKHGNRAITSKSGSADVLEALGIPVDLSPEDAARSLEDHRFAFFFAPMYHPAFKHIAPARKLCAERGQRTLFNFLGPLLNPARPNAQLIGVPRPELCEPMAKVLQALGIKRGMVVSGEVGGSFLDEWSTLGRTHVAEFYQDRGFSRSVVHPEDLALKPASLKDLEGGDKSRNAEIVSDVLAGKDVGPKREAVLLNAGAALMVAGKVRSISEGWDLVGSCIDSGKAADQLRLLSRTQR